LTPTNQQCQIRAERIARTILSEYSTPLIEQFDEAISSAMQVCPGADGDALRRKLEELYSILSPDGAILKGEDEHDEWSAERRIAMRGDFWKRYEMYLEQEKQLPPLVISRLDSLTDNILSLLEDPNKRGKWDRRGMVVGQVQSGKTANYTGLVCKAADAGYKVIIIMAGIHNSLRSQTQLRLDEGFRGIDSIQDRVYRLNSPRIGVGKIQMLPDSKIAAHSLTTSDELGDFKKTTAKAVATYIGNDPVILVIKKNGSILKNLLQWIKSSHVADEHEGDKIVPNIPLLLIDDEADNASINTNQLEQGANRKFKTKQDVTRINALIRQLLQTFSKSAYVGYTATPFANIFIPHDVDTDDEGKDLFPSSFIINLRPPSNYIGPSEVFGITTKDKEPIAALPIVRRVIDSEERLSGQHKITLSPTDLPDSLKEAIRVFILTCAARIARGQGNEHNSMLIHVTRFVRVQDIITSLVYQEWRSLGTRIENGDGARTFTLRDELRELWETDFEPTTERMRLLLPDDRNLIPLAWDEIEPHLALAVGRIEVKQINGTAKDVLDYYDRKDGQSVIAIGGDKLSRGLTLEGLSVSYYLRASRMYDTLMQMGRWFGYRPGYADLCRLYTTPELIEWYKHITAASEELREDFDTMARQGLTPKQYGLKVKTHPDGLTITSAGKLRYGTKVKVSFSGKLVETHRLSKAKADIEHNFAATNKFIRLIEQTADRRKPTEYVWERVPSSTVQDYLCALLGESGMPRTPASDPAKLAEFIKLKNTREELTEWTVALISPKSKSAACMIGGLKASLPERIPAPDSTSQTYIIRNRHILTEANEWIDLSEEEKVAAVAKQKEWNSRKTADEKQPALELNGENVRAVRPKKRGLLLIYPLDPKAEHVDENDASKNIFVFPEGDERRDGKPVIGFAISFPGRNSREDMEDAVEYEYDYVVNRVYMEEELAGYQKDEELNNNAD